MTDFKGSLAMLVWHKCIFIMLQQSSLNFFSLYFHLFLPFLHDLAYKDFVKFLELTLKGTENEISWYVFAYAEDGLLCATEFALCRSEA